MELTSKQRSHLRGMASTINPIFQIGKASLTPEIISAVDDAIEKREFSWRPRRGFAASRSRGIPYPC